MSKVYNQAPLPFQGQKRKFLKEFKIALNDFKGATFIDLFGGSGLLSHTAKSIFPGARVIYNDFDDYSKRLRHVKSTNALLAKIRSIVGDYPKDQRLPVSLKEVILGEIAKEQGLSLIHI